MSILSKIFIVLLVVLTIALSVSVMIVHRDYLTYKTNYIGLTGELAQVNQVYLQARTDFEKSLADLQNQVATLTTAKAATERQLSERTNDVKAANAALAETATKLSNTELLLASTAGNLKTASEERNAAMKDLTEQRAMIDKLQKDNAQYAQKLTEAEAAKTFLIQQNKLQSEQISLLQKQLADMSGRQTSAGPVRPAGGMESIGATIKSHITAVTDDLATVDVGKADGVEPGMRFFVFRGDKYMADLVVTRVETSTSVGRLELVKQQVQVKDNAWNKLEEN